MAEAAATTRPSRARKATPAKAAPAKAAAAKATEVEAERISTEGGETRIPVVLEHVEDTKRYAKFGFPASSGCVGNVYAPLGTTQVKMLLIGPAE